MTRGICQAVAALASVVLFSFDTRVTRHPRALATIGVEENKVVFPRTGKLGPDDEMIATGFMAASPISE